MIPDAEIISLVCTILSKLDVGEFTIKINHRRILDGIFEVCGVPADKIRAISSAVDKLDKVGRSTTRSKIHSSHIIQSPWSEVKHEMVETKGLDPAVADKIGEYVKHKGGPELLEKLKADAALTANPCAKVGIEEMGLLFSYLKSYKVLDRLSFDMSLARGLDYYTGIIYEAIVEASAPPGFNSANTFADAAVPPTPKSPAPPKKKSAKKAGQDEEDEEIDESTVGVGSIAAGGRYDGLVGMFTAAAASEGKKAQNLPCVGVSIGLDRVFAIVWPHWVSKGMRSKDTMVYVMAAGDGLLNARVELVQELRANGIKVRCLCICLRRVLTRWLVGLPLQGETETERAVRSRRARRGSVCDHPRRERAQGRACHCEGAALGARRREEAEDRERRQGQAGEAGRARAVAPRVAGYRGVGLGEAFVERHDVHRTIFIHSNALR